MLNSLLFWSKQTMRRWRSLCSCVLWSFLSTTWSDLFDRLSAKSPDFLWLAGKQRRQDFICLWFSLKYFPTSKLCWPCEYLILVRMLSNWPCLLFYIFTDLDKVSVYKHKNFITFQKSLVKPIFNFVHFYAPF